MHPLAADVAQHGYCVLPSVYSAEECSAIRSELDAAFDREQRRGRGGQFGQVFHPLLDSAPAMARFYLKPEIIEVLRHVLQDDVNLAHTGALLQDETREACQWHSHDGRDMHSNVTWSPSRAKSLDHVSRVLCNVYVDGSTDENGPLVVYPRKLADPWAPPSQNQHSEEGWDGKHVVYMPPGSACIFDACMFHSARPPAATAGHVRRCIFGGHYTGWHNRRRHREDNFYQLSSTPLLAEYENRYPHFFLPRPVVEGATEENAPEGDGTRAAAARL
jgi:ectoine hydroxylase-related dioxygenase (phytanoyl-CoA dioxygenase family)